METMILLHRGLKSTDTTLFTLFFFPLTCLLIKLRFLRPIMVISPWKIPTVISPPLVCYVSLRKPHSTWMQISVFRVSALGVSPQQQPEFTGHLPQISSHHCPGILQCFSDNQALPLSRCIFLLRSLQTPHCLVIISLQLCYPWIMIC